MRLVRPEEVRNVNLTGLMDLTRLAGLTGPLQLLLFCSETAVCKNSFAFKISRDGMLERDAI